MNTTKRCCTCQAHKPLDAFSKSSGRKDGLQPRCRACIAEYYQKNREKVNARVAKYKLDNPEKVRESKRKYRENNPERVAEQKRLAYEKSREYYNEVSRLYWQNNPERLTDAHRAWVAANPTAIQRIKSEYKHRRRNQEAENGIYKVTHRDLNRALSRTHNSCAYCAQPFHGERKVTWDHIIPVTRGGTYSVGNLAPCCAPCNSSKNNRTLMEWKLLKARVS